MSYRFGPFVFFSEGQRSGANALKLRLNDIFSLPCLRQTQADSFLIQQAKPTCIKPGATASRFSKTMYKQNSPISPIPASFARQYKYEPPVTTGGSFAVKQKLER